MSGGADARRSVLGYETCSPTIDTDLRSMIRCAVDRAKQSSPRPERGAIFAIEAASALLRERHAARETRRIDVALRTAKLVMVKTELSRDAELRPEIQRVRTAEQ